VGAAEALEVGEDGGSALVVGLDVVVLEEGGGGAAGVLALLAGLVEDAALAAGGVASPRAGVDGSAFGVVEQQGHERVGEQLPHRVVGQWGAVGEGVAVFSHVHDDLGGDRSAASGDEGDESVGALLGE
jgi:hypothetical protein